MKNIKVEDIEQLIEKKIAKMMEKEVEDSETAPVETDEGTTIHIHHDFSLYLLLYFYMINHHQEPNHKEKHPSVDELIRQVDYLSKKNEDFYLHLKGLTETDIPNE